MAATTQSRHSYSVGVICALAVEKAAIEAMLDKKHPRLEKMARDENDYTLGRIGDHDVAIACLPAGEIGKASAATVARDMMRSFPIKVGLLVGIGAGVWSEKVDVRLGDVVVSQPDGMHGGVVQWDFGKMEKEGKFRRTGSLNKPPRPLLVALQSLKVKHMTEGSEIPDHLTRMLLEKPRMVKNFSYQGAGHDQLFEASYSHLDGDTCADCNPQKLVQRPCREDSMPSVHYGNVASGDELMKDGVTRDRIAAEEGVICFEMEAAGLIDSFPCVVVRGVCDYADSHKNKRWQSYAAATAAAYAKELLGVIDRQDLEALKPASELE